MRAGVVSVCGAAAIFAAGLSVRLDQSVAAQGAPVQAPPPGQGPGAPAAGNPGGPAGGRRGGPLPGAAIYAASCAGCHGVDAAGGRARSLFEQRWLDSTSDAAIGTAIRDGRPGTEMAAFKDFTDEQIFQLIQYIRTQGGAPLRPRAQFNASPHGTVLKTSKETVAVELVTEGLTTPWALAFLPDGRMLVSERDGRLQLFANGKLTVVTGTPKPHVQQDGGYLDVEVHPQYARNGWIYLAYVEDQPGYVPPPPPPPAPAAPVAVPGAPPAEGAGPAAAGGGGRGGRGGRGGSPQTPSMTVVVRGKISPTNAWTDEQTIFRAPTDLYTSSGAHYGSRLLFDRDNHLFFTLGDRNSSPNPAQDLKSPLGKVHRFNDDGTTPKDNPFVNTPGAVGSIWTYGHRNPEGLAWDPVSGNLWASEHGPNSGDEINILVKGHNYGWNLVSKQGPPQYKLSEPGMDDPVVYYTPTFAPAGIAFYSGSRYPGWKSSSLFVTGLAGQALRRLEVKGSTVVTQEVVFNEFGRVRDIVEGPDGYFYIAVQDPTGIPNPAGGNIPLSASTAGRVIRLVPAR